MARLITFWTQSSRGWQVWGRLLFWMASCLAWFFVWFFALFLASSPVWVRAESNATFKIDTDKYGQKRIKVEGSGSVLTLTDVKTEVEKLTGGSNQVVNLGSGIWRLNMNLYIGAGVTLTLSPATGVNELQLRSDAGTAGELIDYASFVYLHTFDGVINFDGIKLYSWDAAARNFDLNYTNGRAYVLARYAATLNIRNSELSYLGSDDGESYGVSWRDVNDPASPTPLLTRVTGEVISSKFHHNYYGIYTFQASNMIFRGNEFYNNVRYGFDPHDFTHHVLVENNSSHDNGAHGFILSRGCNNFTLRGNKAYNNSDPTTNLAHGFMLDLGSPSASFPQEPSFDNLLENNEAWNNEGYGLRILGSNNNTIRNNHFYQNLVGVVVDTDSTANTIRGNLLDKNSQFGIQLRVQTQNTTVEGNQIVENVSHGLYVQASKSLISQNVIRKNGGFGIYANASPVTPPETPVPPLNNKWSQNQVYENVLGGIVLLSGANNTIAAPQLEGVINQRTLMGAAKANARVEIFADLVKQGQYFEGEATVNSSGRFSLTISSNLWKANNLTAIVIDSNGDASTFAIHLPAPAAATPTPTGPAVNTPTPTRTSGPIPSTATPTKTPEIPTSTPTPTATVIVDPPIGSFESYLPLVLQ